MQGRVCKKRVSHPLCLTKSRLSLPRGGLRKQVRIHGKGFFWNMRTPNPYDELVHAVSEASPAAGPGPTRCAACSQTTPDMKNVSCVAVHVSHFTA